MARPRKSAAERTEQRQRLQAAARDLYTEVGLDGVTARAVAERSGLSSGTLYSYFSSVGELLRSLWIEPVADANDALITLAGEHLDPVQRIRALLEAYVDFAATNPDIVHGAMLFVRPSHLERPAPIPLDELPFYRLLVEAITEGISDGAITLRDPQALAQVLRQ